jgi:hypothetical protein
MMKRFLVLAIFLSMAFQIYAVWDQELIEQNNIGIYITNFGIVGHDAATGNSGCWWPNGYPLETYIFGSGIWIGGLIDTAFTVIGDDTTFYYDTLVSCGYNAGSGMSEFVPGDGSDNPNPYTDPNFRVYLSNEFDYPIDTVLSQLDSYCVMNEMDQSTHFIPDSKPLGLVIKQFTYEFSSYSLADVLFIRISMINTTDKRIRKAYISYNIDSDIGNESGTAANDLLGFIENKDIGYQFQMEEEAGWVHTPGVIGWTYIQGPIATDTVDVLHDGSVIIYPGDSLGMTSFNYYTIGSDPATVEERYLKMAGYDITLFDSLNPEASYSPFPSWGTGIAGYPGETQDASLAADKRFLISSGPFDIAPFDTVELVVAFAIKSDPDSMVSALDAAKNLRKNRNSEYVNLISPPELQKISSPVSFTWNASKSLSYYDLTFVNASDGNLTNYTGDNVFSKLVDPTDLSDGIYKWNVANYSLVDIIISKENRYVIIDNPGENGLPVILSFNMIDDGGIMKFEWETMDPDDNLSYQLFEMIDVFGKVILSEMLSPADTQIVINAYNTIPNGDYTINFFAVDDSSAYDSISALETVWFNRPGDGASRDDGDNNTIDVSYITYNKTLYNGHSYEVRFDFPFTDGYLKMPFSVIDSNLNTTVLVDTAIFDSEPDIFYSKLFDGVGLQIDYLNSYNQICDSLKITNDVGADYPDSLLYTELSIGGVYAGRDIEIQWHNDSDSLYADFVIEGYADMVPYRDNRSYNYYYGSSTAPSDYIFTSSLTRTVMYLTGITIYFNNPGRPVPMDTLWAPEEGEVWKLFTSGDRLPIKGDVYKFRPTGVGAYSEAKKMNKLSLMCDLKGSQLTYTITGSAEDIELKLYDIQGRNVKTIFKGRVIGRRDSKISLEIPSGIYFLKEKDGKFETKKLLMIK